MTVSDQETFTIEELAKAIGRWLKEHRLEARYSRRVSETPSERTIRYYRTHALLDPPQRDGVRNLYTRKHMLQLLAIKALQTRGFAIGRIQAELFGRSEPELEALVAEVLRDEPPAEPLPIRELLEVSLAPGVRLLADRSVLVGLDEEARRHLIERLEATLDAHTGVRGRGSRG